MGLFDTIYYKEQEFQTKDLECAMYSYDIKDDKLYRRLYRSEPLPESEWKYMKGPKTQEGSKGFCYNKTKSIRDGEKDIEFHGWINIYRAPSRNTWEEYRLKFTDGKLVEVIEVQKNESKET